MSLMTGTRDIAVFGMYRTVEAAEKAVDCLLQTTFSASDISVLLPDEKGAGENGRDEVLPSPVKTTRLKTGGVVGGTLGLLAGIAALAIPGVGPLIAAGPLVVALAGVGVGGAVGGLVGTLVHFGIPEFVARRYAGQVRDGGVLLSVHCETQEKVVAAEEVLRTTGAQDISSG